MMREKWIEDMTGNQKERITEPWIGGSTKPVPLSTGEIVGSIICIGYAVVMIVLMIVL